MKIKKRYLFGVIISAIVMLFGIYGYVNETKADEHNDISQYANIVDWHINEQDNEANFKLNVDKPTNIEDNDIIKVPLPNDINNYKIDSKYTLLQNLIYNNGNIGSWKIAKDNLSIIFHYAVNEQEISSIDNLNFTIPVSPLDIDKNKDEEQDLAVDNETSNEATTNKDEETNNDVDTNNGKDVDKDKESNNEPENNNGDLSIPGGINGPEANNNQNGLSLGDAGITTFDEGINEFLPGCYKNFNPNTTIILYMYYNGGKSGWAENDSATQGPSGQIGKCYPKPQTYNPAQVTKDGETFLGWIILGGDYNPQTTFSNINTDLSIVAVFSGGVNVIYDPNGGSLPDGVADKVNYKPADTVDNSNLPTPEKRGNTFAGWWYTPQTTSIQTSGPMAGFPYMGVAYQVKADQNNYKIYYDQTYVAHWQLNSYTLTYDLQGGSIAYNANPSTYTYSIGVPSFVSPTKDGYAFAGWYNEPTGGVKITSIGKDDVNSYNLYAQWNEIFNISYDLADGVLPTGTNNPSTYEENVGIPAADITAPTKTGYDFAGWKDQNGNIVDGISNTTTGDVTLTAQWTAKSYTITYHLNNGVQSDSGYYPTSYSYGDTLAPFSPLNQQAGYDFAGWYTDASFTNPITNISATTEGDLNLYAKFTPRVFTITWVLNGGEFVDASLNPTTYVYGVQTIMFGGATKATGPDGRTHQFLGWFNAPVGGGIITNLNDQNTGDVTLWAHFTNDNYTITYDLNGGALPTGETNPSNYDMGVGVPKLNDPVKEHYQFLGWYDNAQFTGDPYTSIATTEGRDIHLYAKYVGDTYNISYDLDGGTNNANNPKTYVYGTGVPNLGIPTKTGYKFNGWEDVSNNQLISGIGTDSVGDVSIKATWSLIDYKITYNLNGGTNDNNNPDTYNYGETITFANPTKTGYTFDGWTDAQGDTITGITSSDFGNKVVNANWTANKYDIHYNLNADDALNNVNNPPQYTYGNTITFQPPSRLGYTFDKWVDDSGNPFPSITATTIGNVNVNAVWTANTYTITYAQAGGVYKPTKAEKKEVEFNKKLDNHIKIRFGFGDKKRIIFY